MEPNNACAAVRCYKKWPRMTSEVAAAASAENLKAYWSRSKRGPTESDRLFVFGWLPVCTGLHRCGQEMNVLCRRVQTGNDEKACAGERPSCD